MKPIQIGTRKFESIDEIKRHISSQLESSVIPQSYETEFPKPIEKFSKLIEKIKSSLDQNSETAEEKKLSDSLADYPPKITGDKRDYLKGLIDKTQKITGIKGHAEETLNIYINQSNFQ